MSYPKVASYAANRTNGAPLLRPDGAVDEELLRDLSRYPLITLDITPWFSVRGLSKPDALLRLRQMNPSIVILGYQSLAWWWYSPDTTFSTADPRFSSSWHSAIRATGGFWDANGEGWLVRWENPATEAKLTQLLCLAASSRLFDGLFFDFLSETSSAAGAAMQRMVHAVRKAGGPGFLVLGNGWSADALDTDGSFREGFPDSFGHDFEHIRKWRAGRPHRSHDWLQAGTGSTSLDFTDAQRAARFALGTACLFDCYASFGPDRDLSVSPSYLTWWNEVYDGGWLGAGWLGEAMGPAWRGPNDEWRRDFGGGIVLVNPTEFEHDVRVPPGHRLIGGPEVGSVTVPARDSVFLVRAR